MNNMLMAIKIEAAARLAFPQVTEKTRRILVAILPDWPFDKLDGKAIIMETESMTGLSLTWGYDYSLDVLNLEFWQASSRMKPAR